VVKKLKEESGKDIMVMDNGMICPATNQERLIDESMFIMTPVIASEGKPLFKDGKQHSLKLLGVKPFDSGNVVMHYGAGK
jgi:dihydrofolate reductase